MEFLTTPDLAGAARWTSATPGSAAPRHPSHPTPRAGPLVAATPHAAASAPRHGATPALATPAPPPAAATPRAVPSYAPLDRAGIKSSFQSLFSPSPSVGAPTPALYARAPPTMPGLTPFINGMPTPSLVPPGTGMMPNYTPGPTPHIDPASQPAPSPDMLSSPYLQAAAKEAVRREFMNMPSYVTPAGHPAGGERVVPGKDYFSRSPAPQHHPQHRHHLHMARPGAVPTPPQSAPQQVQHVSPSSGDAKVPTSATLPAPQPAGTPTHKSTGPMPAQGSPLNEEKPESHHPQGMPPHMQPYVMQPHPQPPHGMVMIGQHGQMMMAGPPPGPMYAAPTGMMMFPGGQQQFTLPGMMMHPQHPTSHMMRPQGQPVKPETQAERKERIEHEKQELIREFKKKTREAALVRFRQKRRERRFGKLIRYDCRKKLADARPRVKGRFVRIKEDEEESEGVQVVPDLENRR